MSGHSKWASIKHKKGAADAKRGKIFSKLAKQISVAAKTGGGDLGMNFGLRLAVEKAKAANMPKDNIERAIKRGTGEGADALVLESAVYELMGPGGSALIVEALTDNKNRTYGSLRTIANKKGANIEAKVLWMFARKGVVRIENDSGLTDEQELELIEAGAEDIQKEDGLVIVAALEDLQTVTGAVESLGMKLASAEPEYVANDSLELSDEDLEKLANLVEALEEDDDVDGVYTNVR